MKNILTTKKSHHGLSTVLASFLGLMMGMLPLVSMAQNASIDQAENGKTSAPVSPVNWINGALNPNNSHYLENTSVPYRLVMTDMPVGTVVKVCMGYNFIHNGHYSYDFLTSYDHLNPHNYPSHSTPEVVNPLSPGAIAAPSSTKAINAPSYLNEAIAAQALADFNAMPANQKLISLWGANFVAGAIEYHYFDGSTEITAAQALELSRGVVKVKWIVKFTPTSSTVTMAWGGHISDKSDWGYPPTINTAILINGANYHMSRDFWDIGDDGNLEGGFGQSDLQLQLGPYALVPICPSDFPVPLALCYNTTTQTNYAAGLCPVLCQGGTLTFNVPDGSLANTFLWSVTPATGVTIATPAGQMTDITFANPGQYTINVALQNVDAGAAGPIVICTEVITVLPPPTCNITGDNIICADESTSFTATGGVTYAWTGPGGFTAATATIGPLTVAGTYEVTVTNEAGCQSTCQRTLTVNQLPTVDLPAAGPFCVDANAYQLLGTPTGGTYSGTGVSTTGLFNPATGVGNYLITYSYTDPNGCDNSDQITIVVNPLPVVTLPAAGPFCVDANAYQLMGSPTGGTYTGPGVNATGLFTPATAGVGSHVIRYTYADANGCDDWKEITIVVNPLPVVTLPAAGPFCVDANAFQLLGTPTGGTYSGPGVSPAGLFTPATAGAGSHVIRYTYADGNGCDDWKEITIVVNPLPVVTLPAAGPFCVDANAFQLLGTPTGGTYTGPGVNATGLFTPATAGVGSHVIRYTYADGNGCDDWKQITIVVNPLPVVTLPAAGPFCVDANAFQLLGTPTGGTYSGPGVNATGLFTPLTAGVGNHVIRYTYADGNGCDDWKQITITVNPLPVVTLPAAGPFCVDDPAFQLLGTPAGGTYTGPGVNATGMFTPATAGVGSHVIRYTYADANGCDDWKQITIVVNPLPVSTITGENLVCNYTADLHYMGPAGMSSYKWTISGDGMITSVDNEREVVVSSLAYGQFILTLNVTNSFGCEDAETFTVATTAVCDPACTYTQGYYGNPGGMACIGNPPLLTTQGAMIHAFTAYGSNMVTFGRTAVDRYFTLYLSDINGNTVVADNNIFKMLPGGGTAKALGTYAGGSSFGLTASWSTVPIEPIKKNQVGKIMNGLLSQTIVLWFNLQNNEVLDNVVLGADVLLTKAADCATHNPYGDVVEYTLPHAVVVFLNSGHPDYGNTVTDLFNLANAYLGGETPGSLSPTDVAKAVDVVNNAFDGCRVLMGYMQGDAPVYTRYATIAPDALRAPVSSAATQQPSVIVTPLAVRTFPNPYRDVVKFEIISATGGKVTLQIYDMQGNQLSNYQAGQVQAGKPYVGEYRMPYSPMGSLMYRVTVGKQQTTGKLMKGGF